MAAATACSTALIYQFIHSCVDCLQSINQSIIILLLLPQPAAQLSFDDTLFH